MSATPNDDTQRAQPAPQGGESQQGAKAGEYGEGNYKAARQYNDGLKDHVQHHDIEKEARDAAPKSDDEAREMEEAERIGKSRARGGEQSPDAASDTGAPTR